MKEKLTNVISGDITKAELARRMEMAENWDWDRCEVARSPYFSGRFELRFYKALPTLKECCHSWWAKNGERITASERFDFICLRTNPDVTICLDYKTGLFGKAHRNPNDEPDDIVAAVIAYARANLADYKQMIGYQD